MREVVLKKKCLFLRPTLAGLAGVHLLRFASPMDTCAACYSAVMAPRKDAGYARPQRWQTSQNSDIERWLLNGITERIPVIPFEAVAPRTPMKQEATAISYAKRTSSQRAELDLISHRIPIFPASYQTYHSLRE